MRWSRYAASAASASLNSPAASPPARSASSTLTSPRSASSASASSITLRRAASAAIAARLRTSRAAASSHADGATCGRTAANAAHASSTAAPADCRNAAAACGQQGQAHLAVGALCVRRSAPAYGQRARGAVGPSAHRPGLAAHRSLIDDHARRRAGIAVAGDRQHLAPRGRVALHATRVRRHRRLHRVVPCRQVRPARGVPRHEAVVQARQLRSTAGCCDEPHNRLQVHKEPRRGGVRAGARERGTCAA
eukprot:4005143-Prymnesium_polylepis.1